MTTASVPQPDDVVTVLPGDRTVFGMQLPVQSQSTIYVQPWEPAAGPEEMAAVALACEDAGFFYVGVCDHTFIPERLAAAMGTTWYDTVATLGWLAGITTRIRLLSHIYVVALRHPLRAAKEFATLDVLSGGRVICGVGAGHVRRGVRPHGAGFRRARQRPPTRPWPLWPEGWPPPVPDARRAALEGGSGVGLGAPAGAVAPTAHLGRGLVAGRPAPGRPVRRRLAAPVAGRRPGHAR